MSTDAIPTFCTVCGKALLPGERCSHAAPPPFPKPKVATRERRSLGEILLDPHSIQWLLVSGAVLLVTGMVIWLGSMGVFDDPYVVATALGAGTILLLGAGWWVIRGTPLQLAGKAVTLLACLIMPLNLWFYHSHQLLMLDGNLWMAAAVCCALYAASALVLRDPLFVYVLMAGVAGTGMLILTDMHRFAEIAAPSTMLIVMGLIGIHAERAFPQIQSPFSRERFGAAFFRSGHALLGGGLLLILGAQCTGWFFPSHFMGIAFPTPLITIDHSLKLLSIGLVLAGSYAYLYSGVVPHRTRRYAAPAMLTLLWAELLGLQMLDLTYRAETILLIAAATGLAVLIASRWIEGLRHIGGRIGNGIILLSFMCSTMLLCSRLLVMDARWSSLGLAGAMSVMSLIAVAVVGRSGWRRGHVLMSVASGTLALVVLSTLSHLGIWQKLEVASVVGGLMMLTTGHIGWYREQNRSSEMVSFNLLIGSLLAGLPLLIAALVNRFAGDISLPDEMGLLTVSSLLLITGLMLQLRSTTITGGALLSLHVAVLLAVAGWRAQLALGVYLAIGGGLIFLIGLGLAIHRERLLELPARFHRREGLFRVLAWR